MSLSLWCMGSLGCPRPWVSPFLSPRVALTVPKIWGGHAVPIPVAFGVPWVPPPVPKKRVSLWVSLWVSPWHLVSLGCPCPWVSLWVSLLSPSP